MKNILILLGTIFNCSFIIAQINGVGIGTQTPTHTLEVNGNLKLSENLYMENPGTYTGNASDAYLLVRDNNDKVIKRYVPATSAFSAINSAVYYLRNVNPAGLNDFNTGVSATDYYLVIGGFIVRGENDNPVVSLTQQGTSNQYVPQYSARSYIQNGLWHIKFTPNNGRVFNLKLDIRLSVSVYRRDMLTTINTPITYNMNGDTSGTGSAPVPVLP
ncbi:hypothetical protein [Chryseobacterium sp. Leaf201]|uniref:hypothetical protein n=1 Tax=Chryseobacterium sp. Leaf201 TaxID=1735672 RepID=UPI0006F80FFF|nr:hypothetical protein [Chryseobacterium sp. Leaf201]KQM38774.1 hypothetical protein ASE55_14055 [Chryseobacterium sp. Leaf201]